MLIANCFALFIHARYVISHCFGNEKKKWNEMRKMKSRVLLEDIVSVTSEAKASVSHESHVLVIAIGWRGGFGEVTLGLQAVHEGHPFGPRVGVWGA